MHSRGKRERLVQDIQTFHWGRKHSIETDPYTNKILVYGKGGIANQWRKYQ
jgi:hypothetical protein